MTRPSESLTTDLVTPPGGLSHIDYFECVKAAAASVKQGSVLQSVRDLQWLVERHQALCDATRGLLRFRPGNEGPDGWIEFAGSDAEWDRMESEAWQAFADALSALEDQSHG